jgi:hypothetical protein
MLTKKYLEIGNERGGDLFQPYVAHLVPLFDELFTFYRVIVDYRGNRHSAG